MSYTIDFLKYNLAPALELLCDTVVNPALLQQDIDEQKARLTGVLASPEVGQQGQLCVWQAHPVRWPCTPVLAMALIEGLVA